MEERVQPSQEGRSRREFLANLFMGTGVTLGLGSLFARFFEYLYPVVEPVKLVEVLAAKTTDIPSGAVHFVQLAEGPVMIENVGGQLDALSAVCTHMGCIVKWYPELNQFVCPCHRGVYGIEGNNISGPPPRPLNKLSVKVRDGNVYVMIPAQQVQA
jgi:cytochrome b6-f complex iron-sulfur subunit